MHERAPAASSSRRRPPQLSFVQDRIDLARRDPGRPERPATRSTSRSTATPISRCRRRAASATPATARSRSTAPASWSPATGDAGARRGRPDRVPAERDRDVTDQPGRHDHACGKAANADRRRPRQAAPGVVRQPAAARARTAPAPSWRPTASAPHRPRTSTCGHPGLDRKSNVRSVMRDGRA